ncbi:FG-GAP-like repeat-containing protein, partial [Elusimicrobiota bacterium]
MVWFDYDNDKDLDLFVCGEAEYSERESRLYRNNGNGTFKLMSSGSIKRFSEASLSCGDFDNNGEIDLAICGETDDGYVSTIYRNTNGNFDDTRSNFSGVKQGDIEFGDYNNDGVLDIAVCGYDGSGAYSKIFTGYRQIENSTPTAPVSDFSSTYNQDTKKLELRWADGTDSETMPDGLCYEIRMATNPLSDSLKTWIISPSVGKGVSPTMGNYPKSRIKYGSPGINVDYEGLISEKTHYWQVRSIDTGFEKSEWSPEQSVYISDVHAPAPVSHFYASTGQYGLDIDLSWSTPGDDGLEGTLVYGSKYKIQYSTWVGASFSTVSAQIMVSTQSVPPETIVSHIFSGMSSYTTYYFAIWYSDEADNWSEVYNTTNAITGVDTSAPAGVTALTADPKFYGGKIFLAWPSPGDDGLNGVLGTGSEFLIQYSSWNGGWDINSVDVTVEEAQAVNPGEYVNYDLILQDYFPNTTYYFVLWHRDGSGNLSDISNIANAVVEADSIDPSAVTTLEASQGYFQGEVDLAWNTPGNDGIDGVLGPGSEYRIQYSSSGIVWSTSSAQIIVSTSGVDQSGSGSYTVSDLEAGLTYYFRIWYMDGVGNWSDESNPASAWANILTLGETIRNDRELTGVRDGCLAWGDYDSDGDLDLAICGNTARENLGLNIITKIYRNDGNNNFVDIEAGITGIYNGELAWADYDNDGDLDLALSGQTLVGLAFSGIYQNDGNGVFAETSIALPQYIESSLAWGDCDNDGDLDLAICGTTGLIPGYQSGETRIYMNNGYGNLIMGVSLEGVFRGS